MTSTRRHSIHGNFLLVLFVTAVALLSRSVAATLSGQAAPPSGSAITGTVVDENGMPMASVDVQAYERAAATMPMPYRDGDWELRPVGAMAMTDDKGQYRLETPPGEYYVRARATTVPKDQRQVYWPMFYPAATDPVNVNPVKVPAGAALTGIDFRLRSMPPIQMNGRVLLPTPQFGGVGIRSSTLLTDIQVALIPIGFGSNLSRSPDKGAATTIVLAPQSTGVNRVQSGVTVASTRNDGLFNFGRIQPGAYRVVAAGMLGARRISATQDIYVTADSAPDLTLPLQYGFGLQGRINIRGPAPTDFQLNSLRVNFELTDSIGVGWVTLPSFSGFVPVKPDGSFVIQDVAPDMQYKVILSGIDDNSQSHVSELRYGSKATSGGGWIKANKEQTSLGITLEFGLGRVNVQVRNGEAPRPGLFVGLLPTDRRRPDLHGLTDADGMASFTEVVPGVYEAFAFEVVTGGSWNDLVSSKAFKERGRGELIHVEGAKTLNLVITISKDEGKVN
ncbi:MAG TPA: carboxypeptidase-like regulatory domain-containing protein [Terriglobia bacterium]|nr:carboxypeptidase-like regulatory domain-containing protein [Terriglobia bacterium]